MSVQVDPKPVKVKLLLEVEGEPVREYTFPLVTNAVFDVKLRYHELGDDDELNETLLVIPTRVKSAAVSLSFTAEPAEPGGSIYTLELVNPEEVRP